MTAAFFPNASAEKSHRPTSVNSGLVATQQGRRANLNNTSAPSKENVPTASKYKLDEDFETTSHDVEECTFLERLVKFIQIVKKKNLTEVTAMSYAERLGLGKQTS